MEKAIQSIDEATHEPDRITSKINEITDKIIRIDESPTYEEATRLLDLFDQRVSEDYSQEELGIFCHKNNIYMIYTKEFIDELARKISLINNSPIIEICAGNGKLSHQLRKRGIDIAATDDYSWGMHRNETLVERISHRDALQKYNPKIVVASWIPYKSRVGFDVLDFPSTKYFIDIGESMGNSTWMTEEIYEKKEWEETEWKRARRFSVCRMDYIGGGGMEHSCVTVFRKIIPKPSYQHITA